jgi:hypothetical protein
MSDSAIPLQEFINGYKESLGVDGAEQLFTKVLLRANLARKPEYSKDEALKICRELKQYPGFVGIIGGILNSRIIIR